MGALPKRKISKQRKRKRRSHHGLEVPHLVRDKKTGKLKPSHTVDPVTGKYDDKKIVSVD